MDYKMGKNENARLSFIIGVDCFQICQLLLRLRIYQYFVLEANITTRRSPLTHLVSTVLDNKIVLSRRSAGKYGFEV